ncbi:class I SAM-dependent methyltransferase [Streptomyces microflavus]|uniref:class I SAM-dependent methyltransferase n=1 Tax=Streptomyces microflavus TaxID=1919 RepID=UPI0033B63821
MELPRPELLINSVERLESVVAKVVQECQNGLPERVIHLSSGVGWPALRKCLSTYARRIEAPVEEWESGLRMRLPRVVVVIEKRASSVVVHGHRAGPGGTRGGALLPVPERAAEVWQLAGYLTGLADAGFVLTGAEERLRAALKHESWLVATLACDVLNRFGVPAVPRFVRDHEPHRSVGTGAPARGDGTFTEVWEARISVDEYALFEAVHPGYAVQMVELGRMVRSHCRALPESVLDVGSGPGLPTVMLAEMFPGARIDAVEPSPAAIPHLVRNTAAHAVSVHRTGITDFAGPRDYPVTVSVGASHHMDTRMFLRGLKRHTAPGGLIVVADEMVAPYASESERSRAVIDHHFAYIDQALAHVPDSHLPPAEQLRIRALRDTDRRVPELLADLLEEVRQDRWFPVGDDSPWQRVRFCVLELEALVAGVDYDVERKTWVENFMTLAQDEGLEPVEHRRVHATVGGRDLDAGTHVVALRKSHLAPLASRTL